MILKKLFVIIFISLGVGFSPTLYADSEDQVYILCYHTYLGKKSIPTDFSLTEFKSQLQTLKDMGYNFVSWQDIVSNRVRGPLNVLITIDDGNKTVLPAYHQVLKPLGIKPVLFIYPAIIGKVHYAMKFSQLKDLKNAGVDIGAHGYYHEFVNTKLFKRSPKDFWREIKTTKTLLEKNLNMTIDTYAYPFGEYDDLTVKSLAETKYAYGFKLGQTPQALPLPSDESRFVLTRYLITRGNWRSIFKEMKHRATLDI